MATDYLLCANYCVAHFTGEQCQCDCSTWPGRRLFLVTLKDYHGAKVDGIFDISTVKYLVLPLLLGLPHQVLM
jgi:hypothetical protein